MVLPCIVISRHMSGFYEWSVICDQVRLDGDVGDDSIGACLLAALAGLPDDYRLLEVQYRGLHMGTFEQRHILECTDDVAAKIAAAHGVLTYGG